MSAGVRVLLMDDDEDLAYLTRRMASKLGFELAAVADADAAVHAFAEARSSGTPFTVLILDATIPGGRGAVQVLRELREVDPWVGAVLISGWSHGGVIPEAEAHGFDATLVKPFDIDQLEKAVVNAAVRSTSNNEQSRPARDVGSGPGTVGR